MVSMFFGSCMSVCVTPYVVTTILMEFHASVFQIALVPVVVQVGGFLALPMAIACSSLDHKKVVIFLFALGRAFLIALVFVMIVETTAEIRATVAILFAYSLMTALGMSAVGPTNSWLRQVIPEHIQAAFLGKRNALCSVVMGGLTPALGYIIGRPSLLGLDSQSIYVPMMAFAVIAGYIDLLLLSKVQGCSDRIGMSIRGGLRELKSAWKNRRIWYASIISVAADVGTLLVAPFLILLYYDMGMSKFTVAIVTALSMLGTAVGFIVGGRFSDRLLIRRVFISSSLLRTFCHCCLLGLSIVVFSCGLAPLVTFASTAAIAFFAALSQGCIGSAHIKYCFAVVKNGSSISFAFIACVMNLTTLIVLMSTARFGSLLSSRSDMLSHWFWNGFHYTQVLFFAAISASILSCIYFCRAGIFKNLNA